MKWIGFAMCIGMGLFVGGALFSEESDNQRVNAISVTGFAILFLVGLFAQFVALRCHQCRGNLGMIIMRSSCLYVDGSLRFCPYCGCGMDDQLPEGKGH
jgi:hypothetical protein